MSDEIMSDIAEYRSINERLSQELKEKEAIDKFRSGEVLVLPKKSVFAKLPSSVSVAGRVMESRHAGQYRDLGNDKNGVKAQNESGFSRVTAQFNSEADGVENHELFNSHFVNIAPIDDDPSRVALGIHFYQDTKAIDSRWHYTPGFAEVSVPRVVLDELIEKFRKDPDELEKFYQANFPDLDSINADPATGQKYEPGLRRVAAEGFYIIDEDTNKKMADKVGKIKIKDLYDEFLYTRSKYIYKGKKGVGDPLR